MGLYSSAVVLFLLQGRETLVGRVFDPVSRRKASKLFLKGFVGSRFLSRSPLYGFRGPTKSHLTCCVILVQSEM